MTKEGALQWIGDHIFHPWWVRYLILPLIQSAPTAVAALLIGLGDRTICGVQPALVVFSAFIWGIGVAAIVAGLERNISLPAERYKRERAQLLRLIAHIRVIVWAKSRRFHETSDKFTDPVDPAIAFLQITQPDFQIREIIRAIREFFKAEGEPDEDISVSLMEFDRKRGHLAVLAYFPDSSRPRAPETAFYDESTIAGKALLSNDIVVSEDIATDSNYQQFGRHESGSMFAYPIENPYIGKVALVVNVGSNRIRRFRNADREALKIPMDVFGERLLLEYLLRDLRQRAERSREAG
jgi:hypothetical protein